MRRWLRKSDKYTSRRGLHFAFRTDTTADDSYVWRAPLSLSWTASYPAFQQLGLFFFNRSRFGFDDRRSARRRRQAAKLMKGELLLFGRAIGRSLLRLTAGNRRGSSRCLHAILLVIDAAGLFR